VSDNSLNISFMTGIEYGGSLYLSATYLNGLFRYDMEDDKLEFIDCFKQETESTGLYRDTLLINDEIWFMPEHAKKIAIFNPHKVEIRYIELNANYDKSVWCNFITFGVINNEYVYMIPAGADSVQIIDIINEKVNRISLEKRYQNKFLGAFYKDNKLYVYPREGEDVLCISIPDFLVTVIPYKYNSQDYGFVYYDNDRDEIWNLPYREPSILVEGKTKNFNIKLYNEKISRGICSFISIIDDSLYTVANGYSELLKVSIDDKSVKRYKVGYCEQATYHPIRSNTFYMTNKWEASIYYFEKEEEKLIKIVPEMSLEELVVQVKEKGYTLEDIGVTDFSKQIVYESVIYNAEYLINWISKED